MLSSKSVREISVSWAEVYEAPPAPIAGGRWRTIRTRKAPKNFPCSLTRWTYTGVLALASGDVNDGGAKKPPNASVGEQFLGTFEEEGES